MQKRFKINKESRSVIATYPKSHKFSHLDRPGTRRDAPNLGTLAHSHSQTDLSVHSKGSIQM